MTAALLAFLFSLWSPPMMQDPSVREAYAKLSGELLAFLSESGRGLGRVYEVQRSPEWRGVRDRFVALHPTCAACGSDAFPEVHHIKPYHLFPKLELDPANLITLCDGPYRRCHFVVGHLCDWRSWNVDAVRDAAWLLDKVRNRPKV